MEWLYDWGNASGEVGEETRELREGKIGWIQAVPTPVMAGRSLPLSGWKRGPSWHSSPLIRRVAWLGSSCSI